MAQREQQLRGELRHNEMMAEHTTWRVGGPAKTFYRPADIDDLALFLSQQSRSEPLTFVGMGSNLLVRDGGIDGIVISTKGVLDQIKRVDEDKVYVECGASCAKVARFCAREGLKGAEFLCGIPGTFGGALAMNAGCFGAQTWEIVESVDAINRSGAIQHYTPEMFEISYRSVTGLEDEWFVSAVLNLTQGDSESLLQKNRSLLDERSQKQPTRFPNAGSVFKNPDDDFAARLIEASGLKGTRIGGATVSELHANFIINTGDASATDIEQLIALVKQRVNEKFGVQLQTEVHIIGEAGGHDESIH